MNSKPKNKIGVFSLLVNNAEGGKAKELQEERSTSVSQSAFRISNPVGSLLVNPSVTEILANNSNIPEGLLAEMRKEVEANKDKAITTMSDLKGKEARLSVEERRIVTLLSYAVDIYLNNNKEEGKKLVEAVSWRTQEDKDRGGSMTNLPLLLNLNEMVKIYYGGGRISGMHRKRFINSLVSLSQKRVEQSYGGVSVSAPLFTFGKEIKYEGKYKESNAKKDKSEWRYETRLLQILVEDIFLSDIDRQFCYIPISYFQRLAEAGNSTAIFAQMDYELRRVIGNKVSHAKKATQAFKKDLKEKDYEKDEIKDRAKTYKSEAMKYSIGLDTLLEKAGVAKSYKVKSSKVLENDLARMEKDLKYIGIITEMKRGKNAKGEVILHFYLNENWIGEERNFINETDSNESERQG